MDYNVLVKGTRTEKGRQTANLTSEHWGCINALHQKGFHSVVVMFDEDGGVRIAPKEKEAKTPLFSL
jgi:hypothetical protein